MFKNPYSVLVIIHNEINEVLLLERAQNARGFWQSVTGSLEKNETIVQCAKREVFEETGFAAPLNQLKCWRQTNRFRIFECFQQRYAPGVIENTEYVLSLNIAQKTPIVLNPKEHLAFQWLPWNQAGKMVFSPSNRNAIMYLGNYLLPFV